jgi:hypothetical protein
MVVVAAGCFGAAVVDVVVVPGWSGEVVGVDGGDVVVVAFENAPAEPCGTAAAAGVFGVDDPPVWSTA